MFGWLRIWLNRHREDPAWKPTGYRTRFSGYDQTKAATAAKRAADLADRQKAANVLRAGMRRAKTKPAVPSAENITPFPGRKAAAR